MHLTWDETADAIYVYFTTAKVKRTVPVSECTILDLDAADQPVGVEFLDVSNGIDLNDVPHRADIERLLADHHFPIFA